MTFRIYTPKASEVTLDGEWILQGLGTRGPPQKDSQGIWSITLGPPEPDFYAYTLTEDGVPTIDPQKRMIKQGIAKRENVFLVPGDEDAQTFLDCRGRGRSHHHGWGPQALGDAHA